MGDRIGERMRSRLHEMCRVVQMEGSDFRQRVQSAQCVVQAPGEGTAAWSDLDNMIAGPWIDRGGDAVDNGRVMQEMLPETFPAWRMLHAARVMIWLASSMAAIRLRGSARPVPARSSAVP